MPRNKPTVTRTFGAIHFEDLDPHRFEDLIRELIYDFREWQTIEATGRLGSDDGFDIRAFEKVSSASQHQYLDEEEADTFIHPMDGNRWMIQGKREKTLGPRQIEKILEDVDENDPPYGYILAASANFSKKSFDTFRDQLRKKKVMEFFLWGRPELEDMLHLPKNDRLLFTYFGISLVTKRRSLATAARSIVAVKNKLFKVCDHDPDDSEIYQEILVRDVNDTNYPFSSDYDDFDTFPRWQKYVAYRFHATGLLVHQKKHFAFVNKRKKEFDCDHSCNLEEIPEFNSPDLGMFSERQGLINEFMECMPHFTRGFLIVDALIKYEDIVLVDEKGDHLFNMPHVYVDFSKRNGAFGGYITEFLVNGERITFDNEWRRDPRFPKNYNKLSFGKRHVRKKVVFDSSSMNALKKERGEVHAIYDLEGKYSFLKAREVIDICQKDDKNEKVAVVITSTYKIPISRYLWFYDEQYRVKKAVMDQLGVASLDGYLEKQIFVYEFRRVYDWELGTTVNN